MGSEAPINKAEGNTKSTAHNVGDPVVNIGAAVKAWLDKFNETAEHTCPHKYWKQSIAPGSRKGEGERCKGYHVYQLVAAVGRRRLGV